MTEVGALFDACASFVLQLATGIPAGGLERFFFDAIWQSTLIGVATWGAVAIARHQASLRAGVALLGIVLCIAAPIASALVRTGNCGLRPVAMLASSESSPIKATHDNTHEPALPENAPLAVPIIATPLRSEPGIPPTDFVLDANSITRAAAAGDTDGEPAGGIAPADKTATTRSAAERRKSTLLTRATVAGLMLAGWVAVSAIFLLRFLRSYFSLRRLLRQAQRYEDPETLAIVERAARQLALRRVPQIWQSAAIDSPAIVAWGRGRLLLPTTTQPAAADLYAIACHELAHLKRRDGWSRVTVELACSLLPWQPLMWRMRAMFCRSCEEACDDWVVAAGTDPVDLAATLASWLRPAPASLALGMSESVAVTRRRILRLLAQQKPPRPRLGPVWIAAGLAVAISCGTAMAFWQTPQSDSATPPAGDVEQPPVQETASPDDLPETPAQPDPVRRPRRGDDGPVEPLLDKQHRLLGLENPAPSAVDDRRDFESLSTQLDQTQAELRSLRKRAPADADRQADLELRSKTQAILERQERDLRDRMLDIAQRLLKHTPPSAAAVHAPSAKPRKTAGDERPPYRIGPPDILLIDCIGLEVIDRKIGDGDELTILVSGTPDSSPIAGQFKVGPHGRLALGPDYGTISVLDLDCDEAATKLRRHLETMLVEPKVLMTISQPRPLQQIAGEHLVGPDGRVSLGVYGTVYLSGHTLDESQSAIEEHLKKKGYTATVSASVFSYNSHVYNVVVERVGENTIVLRIPIMGNERVLDGLSQMAASLAPSSKVQLSRTLADGEEEILEVDWQSIVRGKSAATNYQLRAGDRLFVKEAGPEVKPVVPATKVPTRY